MIGRVVESSTIENDSFVSNANVTLGYDIGQFLNDYQVYHFSFHFFFIFTYFKEGGPSASAGLQVGPPFNSQHIN